MFYQLELPSSALIWALFRIVVINIADRGLRFLWRPIACSRPIVHIGSLVGAVGDKLVRNPPLLGEPSTQRSGATQATQDRVRQLLQNDKRERGNCEDITN
jgi:hypothetical protein